MKSSGKCGLDAGRVEGLHRTRRPRLLRGDYRWRTYAMQPTVGWDRAKGRGRRRLVDLCWPCHGPDHNLPANPNLGSGGEKIHGLDAAWRQVVRLETWETLRLEPGDPRLMGSTIRTGVSMRKYFLICAGKKPRIGMTGLQVSAAPLSTRAWDRHRPAGRPNYDCVQRAMKLFLPLCTPAEYRDAVLAWEWLQRVDALREKRLLAPVRTELELKVIARYGILFPPRALLCKECLGLRYGIVLQSQLDPAVAHLFKPRRAPELPDPFALNRAGNQFVHDQLHQTLTRSQLKTKATRAAALAELKRMPKPQRRTVPPKRKKAKDWENVLDSVQKKNPTSC